MAGLFDRGVEIAGRVTIDQFGQLGFDLLKYVRILGDISDLPVMRPDLRGSSHNAGNSLIYLRRVLYYKWRDRRNIGVVAK